MLPSELLRRVRAVTLSAPLQPQCTRQCQALAGPFWPYLGGPKGRSGATKHRQTSRQAQAIPHAQRCTHTQACTGVAAEPRRQAHACCAGGSGARCACPGNPTLTLAGARTDLYTDHSYGGP